MCVCFQVHSRLFRVIWVRNFGMFIQNKPLALFLHRRISQGKFSDSWGTFMVESKVHLGQMNFFERRTIIKKDTEIALLVFSKEF